MPHKNIVFVKLRLDLFEDHRFLFDLSDLQKGLYLMLLGLAGKTSNHIKDDLKYISNRLGLSDLKYQDLKHISKTYPKFKCTNGYWHFENFEEIHNYISGKSQGSPREVQRTSKNRIEENRIDKNKDIPHTKSSKMEIPPKDDVVTYFVSLGGSPDQATEFFEFYGSKGWVVGKSPMKNWKMAASRWHRRNAPTPTTQARPAAVFLKPISTYGSLRGEG